MMIISCFDRKSSCKFSPTSPCYGSNVSSVSQIFATLFRFIPCMHHLVVRLTSVLSLCINSVLKSLVYKVGLSSRIHKLEFYKQLPTFCNDSHNFQFSEIPFLPRPEIPLASNYSTTISWPGPSGRRTENNKQTKHKEVLPCPLGTIASVHNLYLQGWGPVGLQ